MALVCRAVRSVTFRIVGPTALGVTATAAGTVVLHVVLYVPGAALDVLSVHALTAVGCKALALVIQARCPMIWPSKQIISQRVHQPMRFDRRCHLVHVSAAAKAPAAHTLY